MAPKPEKIPSSDSLNYDMSRNGTTMNGSRGMNMQQNPRPSKGDAHTLNINKPRRRPTAYTEQYTPTSHLAHPSKKNVALDEQIEKRPRGERERGPPQQQQRREEMLQRATSMRGREKQEQLQRATSTRGKDGERMARRSSLPDVQDAERERARASKENTDRRRSSNDVAAPSSQPVRSSHSTSSSSKVKESPRPTKKSINREQPTQSRRGQDSNEMTEQEIAEYAGKRAMLRLEQEFSDAKNDRDPSQYGRSNSSFHSAASGVSVATYNSVMDRKKLNRVPQVSKSELIIGEYLGRGNFCDVFEVEWDMRNRHGQRMSRSDSYDEDSELESDEDDEEATRRKMQYLSLVCSNDIRPEIISTNKKGGIDADSPVVGLRNLRGSFSQIRTGLSTTQNLRDPNLMALKCLRPAVRAQPRKFVIGAEDLAHETALLACLDHPNVIKIYGRARGSFATAFQFGSSKVSVNSGDSGKKKERSMNDGYFIILDRLSATLDDTIADWKDEYDGLSKRLNAAIPLPLNVPPPECNLIEHLAKRLKVAYSIASALEYLHSRHVVFRDLKPANVGFDCNDCVKMFDFGFATSIAPLLNEQIRSGSKQQGYGPLTETCGTRRYMAPEVALKLGYGKEVDVYSFGMLLWEICAMEKPFDSIQSVEDFHDLVVLCGSRPPLNADPLWTRSLKELMSRCWSTDPLDRPDMSQVKSMLCMVLRDMNIATMRLKQLKARQSGAEGKRDENGRRSRPVQQQPQQQQQQPAGFLNKWRRRHSMVN